MSTYRQNSDRSKDEDWHTGHDPGDVGKGSNDPPATAEWVTLVISAVILIGIVGAISWLSFQGRERPPIIAVEARVEDVREEESGYYLPIVIRNDGDRTVEDAVIRGELNSGDGSPEKAELRVMFLAAGEQVNGTMVFQEDPATGQLTVGVVSYRDP